MNTQEEKNKELRKKIPEAHKYSKLALTKEHTQFNKERIILSTNGSKTTGHPYEKTTKLDTNFACSQKLTQCDHGPKWKTQTINLEYKGVKNLGNLVFFIYSITSITHDRKMYMLDLLKIRYSCSLKDTVKNIKIQATD